MSWTVEFHSSRHRLFSIFFLIFCNWFCWFYNEYVTAYSPNKYQNQNFQNNLRKNDNGLTIIITLFIPPIKFITNFRCIPIWNSIIMIHTTLNYQYRSIYMSFHLLVICILTQNTIRSYFGCVITKHYIHSNSVSLHPM